MSLEKDAYIAACGLVDGTIAKEDRHEAIELCIKSSTADVRNVGYHAWNDDQIEWARGVAEKLRSDAANANEARARNLREAASSCDDLLTSLLIVRAGAPR